MRGVSRLRNLLGGLGEPGRSLEHERGYEDFNFPGTWRLLQLSAPPDFIDCFNRHGGYFDLREMTWLNNTLPVVVDLHDA